MKQFERMFAGIIALTLLMSGGCTDDDENGRVEKCGEGDTIQRGEYVLVNDDEPHSGYTQCIFDDPSNQTFGWTWAETVPDQQQSRTSTSAYVLYGRETSGQLQGDQSTTSALPISVDDLTSLTIDYDVQVSTSSRYRVGFSSSNYNCSSVAFCAGVSLSIDMYSDYSGVYTDNPYYSAPFQKRVTIDGEDYDFYKDTFNNLVTNYWFVKVRPSLSGILHFQEFLYFLANDGYEKSLHTIDYIEFYQDIWNSGSGSTTIRKYKIDVKSRIQ